MIARALSGENKKIKKTEKIFKKVLTSGFLYGIISHVADESDKAMGA